MHTHTHTRIRTRTYTLSHATAHVSLTLLVTNTHTRACKHDTVMRHNVKQTKGCKKKGTSITAVEAKALQCRQQGIIITKSVHVANIHTHTHAAHTTFDKPEYLVQYYMIRKFKIRFHRRTFNQRRAVACYTAHYYTRTMTENISCITITCKQHAHNVLVTVKILQCILTAIIALEPQLSNAHCTCTNSHSKVLQCKTKIKNSDNC